MVRSSKTGETITVEVDGRFIVWTDGHFGGDAELVKKAKELSKYSVPVRIGNGYVMAEATDKDNPMGAIAAMLGAAPGRARLVGVPTFLEED